MALEKELKYGLTKAEYRKLARAIRPVLEKTEQQDNHYVDHPRLRLRTKKIGLRVRITNRHSATLTLKQSLNARSKSGPAALKVRKEWEYDLPLGAARATLRDPQKLMRLKNRIPSIIRKAVPKKTWENLTVLGTLSNTRHTARPHKDFKIELDHYQLFSKNYYEVELESTRPEQADLWIRGWLHSLGVDVRPRRTSKLRRFLIEFKKRRTPGPRKRRRKK